MHRLDRGVVAVAFALLLVVSMAGPAVASGPTDSSGRAVESAGAEGALAADDATANATQSDDTIVQTSSYALTPDRPGSVQVTLSYEMPDRVQSLRTQFRSDGTVTGTDGFDRVNATTYEWDESTSTPTITLRYAVNETTTRTGPEAAAGQYLFADVGEWALFTRFRTRSEWSYTGRETPVTLDRQARTAGPGTVGERIVYLGAVTTTERTANGQTFRLVVPDAAELVEPREEILDSLTNASRSLRIGDRDERVIAFVAPTSQIEWGVRGLAYGESEFWVRDIERLDDPGNTWLHEYVHTRQAFRTTPETKWLVEATARYYAAQLTLEQERIGFDEYRRVLEAGERSTYDDVVLATPSTWVANANYVKGALGAGRIDLALRAATNRTGTLERVVRELNSRAEPVTQTAFLDVVETTGGAEPRASAVEVTETSEPLSMWSQRTQTRLFGAVPARISYGLPDATDGYRASGPYRNGTVSATPVRLATGETLTVGAVVENTGGKAGAYNATLTVDGRVVSSATGELDAESERTVRLAHTFEAAGEYSVGVGGETVTVVVEAPAEPTVSEVRVDRERFGQGESATVTATVRNDAAVPADGTVAFTRDGETVAQRAVTLGPGNSTELSERVELGTTGTVRLGAGSAEPVTVTVVASTETGSRTGTTGGSGAGFTAAIAVLAALLALLAARR